METYLPRNTIKAARALLEWQQADLAKAAGLSLTAVNNFERKIGVTRESTRRAIKAALEYHGIEFMPDGGLRQIDSVAAIYRFSGADFAAKWTYDIIATVRNSGEKIMTSSYNENFWYKPINRKSNDEYLVWAERMDLKLRTLIPEDHERLHVSPRHYRTLPPEMIGKITYCIYADRLAFVLWKKKQVMVLRNLAIVETFRNQFKYLWNIGKPLTPPVHHR